MPYRNTKEFEALEPVLAQNSTVERRYYQHGIKVFLTMAADYGFDEVRREEINRRLQYTRYFDAEITRRQDLLNGAQRLTRDVQAAEARGVIRRDLLADAFGVAQYATGVPAGEEVPPEKLGMLADQRLRFVVGAAAVTMGPLVPS